jgi:hypothetical protein
MYLTNVFQGGTQALALAVDVSSPLQRVTAWIRGARQAAQEQPGRAAAVELYARAAHYESSQPSFAADLRAAADSLERDAPAQPR